MSATLDSVTVEAVMYRIDRQDGASVFTFGAGDGHTVFRVRVPDWSPGWPIIHNNAEQLRRHE